MHRSVSAALLVLAAGCGTTPATPAAGPVPVEQPPAVSSTPTPGPAKVGGKQVSADDESSMDVTVLRMRLPFTTNVPGLLNRKGYVHAGVEVKACVTKNTSTLPIGVSWAPWALTYPSGIVIEAASSYGDDWWDEPLYPQQYIVHTGRCVRGWIPFEVRSKDGRPERVTYTPSMGPPLEWTVAAS